MMERKIEMKSYFDSLGYGLLKELLIDFIDCRSLVALSMTCRTLHVTISGDGGVADELLFRISPLLTSHRRGLKHPQTSYRVGAGHLGSQVTLPSLKVGPKLHTVNYYEEIRRAKRQFLVSCGEDHTVLAIKRKQQSQTASYERHDVKNKMIGTDATIQLHRDRVVTFGEGGSGQLGHGCESSTIDPQEVTIPDEDFLAGRASVKSVVGGGAHTLVLLTNGKLFGFGDNSSHQLSEYLDASAPILTPTEIPLHLINKPDTTSSAANQSKPTKKVTVSMISCAKTYSAVLLDDAEGTILIFGRCGQPDEVLTAGLLVDTIPFRNTKFRSLQRGQIERREKISEVSAGYSHLLMITRLGKAYSVGSNSHGQLGIGNTLLDSEGSPTLFQKQPIAIQFDYCVNPVSQVAAGEIHSVLLTRDGNLYTWGCGLQGQLGDGKFDKRNYLPSEVRLPSQCFPVLITCGNKHTVVLDINGRVLTCGKNHLGQLGSSTSFFVINRFRIVSTGEFKSERNTFRKLYHVAAGNSHTAVLGNNGWSNHHAEANHATNERKISKKNDPKLYMFGDTDKCGGGGLIRKKIYRIEPTLVHFEGGVTTDNGRAKNKHYSVNYWRSL